MNTKACMIYESYQKLWGIILFLHFKVKYTTKADFQDIPL